jgi:16S rRNA (guanine527-N7)-methyltransferase
MQAVALPFEPGYEPGMALARLGAGWRGRLVKSFAGLGAEQPDSATLHALGSLLDLVVTWNERVDLTAARDADELVDLFVADAIVLAEATRPRAPESWVDVGSGAGAPAIPLALLVPALRLTLVEPKAKRVAFLRTALVRAGRGDVKVERLRSEDLPELSWDVAVSRATLDPARWAEEGARLARRAVWVLLARAEPPELAGHRIDRDRRYRWPLTGAERRAVRLVPSSG